MARTQRVSWYCVLVFAIVGGTMAQLCAHDFVTWDDEQTIWANPRLNPPTWESLGYYWRHAAMELYIPGTYTVWAGLAKLARLSQPDEHGIDLNPWVFHTASVLLHALSSVVVFLLLRRLLASQETGGVDTGRRSLVACFIGALLFGVHPVQVEAVGWISGLKDVLCGLMTVIGLWQYAAAIQAHNKRQRVVRYAIATLSVGIGMLCKPTAMVAPALALVVGWIMLRQSFRSALAWTLPWWAMAAVCATVARLAQLPYHMFDVPWPIRPLVAADAIAFYVWKLLFPVRLAIDYGRTPSVAIARGWIWWTWAIPVAIALALWLAHRNSGSARWRQASRVAIASALLFVISIAPVLGLTLFSFEYYSTVADHYLYLSMLGPALAAAWGVWLLGAQRGGWIGIPMIGVLAILSVHQSRFWQDDSTLFSHALAVNPDSFLAYNGLGVDYATRADLAHERSMAAEQMGDQAEARRLQSIATADYQCARRMFESAIDARKRLDGGVDDQVKSHHNLARVYARLGETEKALLERLETLRIMHSFPSQPRHDVLELSAEIGHDLVKLGRYQNARRYLEPVLPSMKRDPQVQEDWNLVVENTRKPVVRPH